MPYVATKTQLATEARFVRATRAPARSTTSRPRESAADAPSPSHRNPRRSRREQVIDGAAKMFSEYGYYGASLRDIALEVGLSHPGLLHYFASKDELLGAVIDRLEAHAQNALDRVDQLCTGPDTMIRSLTDIWHPASHEMQLLARLDAEIVSGDHPGRFRIARLHRVHEHILEDCFRELSEQGHLRDGVDPAFASRAMFALVLSHALRESTVRTMQSTPCDDSPTDDLRRLAWSFLEPCSAVRSLRTSKAVVTDARSEGAGAALR